MRALLALVLALGDPEYPPQRGLVNDFAGILDSAAKSKIEQSLRGLRDAKNFVLVVVTVKSLGGQSVEQYTVGLANSWKVGEKGKNNGVVFLVAPAEHRVRIENGYGAEGTLTDIESKLLLEERVVPSFKDGKLAQGVVDGTEALVAKLGGTAPPPARAPPQSFWSTKMIIITVVIVLLIILIIASTEGGRDFLVFALEAAASSSTSSSSSSSSSDDDDSSSSSGGSFGGGGASSSW